MSRRIDFDNHPNNQIFQQQNGHIKFSSYQAPIKKSHSLRKVQTNHLSHRPQIHQLPFQIYPQRTKTEVSRQQLVERLLDNRRDKAESLRAQKIKQQQNQIESCTFKPTINAQSKRLAQKEPKDQKETFQRLYQCGLSRMKSLHQCTSSTAIADKENCTFHPNIGDNAKTKTDLAPIYDRLYEIIAEKRQSMRALQQKVKQDQLKDRPQVSSKSKEIIQKKSNFKKNVLQRLFDHMKDKNNKLQKLVYKRQEEITKQCTFQPIVGPSHDTTSNGNFLQRQYKQSIKLQQKMRYLQQNQKLSFAPQINKLSSLLVQGERQGQTSTERLQRLHAQPILQRQLQLQRIEEEIYRQCTFQPEINMISKALQGEPHSHKCNCHPKEENYCFQPQINEKSRIMAHQTKHKKQNTVSPVERTRKELDYKEMKQCTFKPKTLGNGYKSANQKITLDNIPGATSYKARVQKVKAKRKEDQDIKSQLFQLEKRYQQRDHTKPQPFKLSKGEGKIVKLKQQAEQQFRKYHPFKPEILTKFR